MRILVVDDDVSRIKVAALLKSYGVCDLAKSYYQGCNGYLTKPMTPAALAQALHEVGINPA